MVYKAATPTVKAGSVGTSAVTKELANSGANSLVRQARVQSKTNDHVIKFGNSASVAASNTYTSDALADGNNVVQAGAVEVFDIPEDTTHFSVICEDGSSTGGTVWVDLGYGE